MVPTSEQPHSITRSRGQQSDQKICGAPRRGERAPNRFPGKRTTRLGPKEIACPADVLIRRPGSLCTAVPSERRFPRCKRSPRPVSSDHSLGVRRGTNILLFRLDLGLSLFACSALDRLRCTYPVDPNADGFNVPLSSVCFLLPAVHDARTFLLSRNGAVLIHVSGFHPTSSSITFIDSYELLKQLNFLHACIVAVRHVRAVPQSASLFMISSFYSPHLFLKIISST